MVEAEGAQAQVVQPPGHLLVLARARPRQPRQVPLHVGQEHGHADPAELVRQRLQRHRLARARGARHQAVAVRHARAEPP
jgi:hypothetical protein